MMKTTTKWFLLLGSLFITAIGMSGGSWGLAAIGLFILGLSLWHLIPRAPARDEHSRYIPDWMIEELRRRQGGTCALCSETRNLVPHHKLPFSMGGESTLNNLTLLCPNHHAIAHSTLDTKVNYQKDPRTFSEK